MSEREAVIVDTVRTPIGKRKGALAGLAPDRPARLHPQRPRRPHRRRPGPGRRRRRRLRHPGRRAGQQRHPQRVGRRRPAVARARHHGRPPVRLVPAGRALRRPGRDRRGLRPRHRLRRRVDDPRADGARTPAAAPGRSRASGIEAVDGQLHPTQFEVSQILAERSASPARRWTPSPSSATAGPRRTGTTATSPTRSCPCRSRTRRATRPASCSTADEGIRPESTVETLAALPSAASWDPSIAPDITAGNASQMSDGAAAMLIAEREHGRARSACRSGPVFRHFAVAADDAVLVLSAPDPGHPEAARARRA